MGPPAGCIPDRVWPYVCVLAPLVGRSNGVTVDVSSDIRDDVIGLPVTESMIVMSVAWSTLTLRSRNLISQDIARQLPRAPLTESSFTTPHQNGPTSERRGEGGGGWACSCLHALAV